MEYGSILFSLLFLVLFAIYLFLGIYIINLNPKEKLNLVFMAVCISLCFWSFGFSIANSAPDQETCLFWRRISALGWATIYSILLHFLLVLTGRDAFLRRKWPYVVIYLPALVTLYVFSLSDKMTAHQYHLVKMEYGWLNVALNNGWDMFFYLYYIGYGLACTGLIWVWQKQATNEDTRRQAKLILTTILVAILLGSLTDIILNSFLISPLPQIAPIVTLIPILAIYYSIKRYGLLRQEEVSKEVLILNDEKHAIVFRYLAIAFLAVSLLVFLSDYLPYMLQGKGNEYSAFFTSGLLFATGLALYLIQGLKNAKLKNILNMIIMLASIPLLSLRYLSYGGQTVWAFALILIILSVVFNKRTLLLSVTVVAVLTQVILWIYKPQALVQVDGFNYLIRISIIIIAFWIGLYVNTIFMAKLRENAYQSSFQKLVSEISMEFVSVNIDNFEERIKFFLARISTFFQGEQICVVLFDYEKNAMINTHRWCSTGIEARISVAQDIPFSRFPWWLKQLTDHRLIWIEDVNKMPAEATAEKELFLKQEIKSLVAISIEGTKNIQGYLAISTINSYGKWSLDQISMLRTLVYILADGLIKVKAEKEIQYMAFYDHLTGLPNRTLFADRLSQAIFLAKRSGSFVGVMFIDLDGFKNVNDTLGHSGGDELIKKVAQGLKKGLRESDTVARYGGDEFLIMMNDVSDSKDIKGIVDNIMRLFERPFHICGQEFSIKGSAGVSVYPIDGEDATSLTQNADMAMYEAKSKGKNQYVFFTLKD